MTLLWWPCHKIVSVKFFTFYIFTSSDGFLRIGRVTALFWLTDNVHCAKEALHMRAITGAIISSTFLTSHVGAGSRLQCFEGAFLRRKITSSTVTGSNAIRDSGTDQCVISGGGEPTVDDRILATLSSKKAAKSSAEWSAIVIASGCINRRRRRHADFMSRLQDSMASVQWAWNFAWNRCRCSWNCSHHFHSKSESFFIRYFFFNRLVSTFARWHSVSNHGAVGLAYNVTVTSGAWMLWSRSNVSL